MNNDKYLLQDGTYAASSECKKGDDGILRHKGGPAVVLRDDGTPQTAQTIADMNVQIQKDAFGDKSKDEDADAKTKAPAAAGAPVAAEVSPKPAQPAAVVNAPKPKVDDDK